MPWLLQAILWVSNRIEDPVLEEVKRLKTSPFRGTEKGHTDSVCSWLEVEKKETRIFMDGQRDDVTSMRKSPYAREF